MKLKFSRMLTCYSGIMYLLSKHVATGTVSPEDVKAMVRLTPTERLEHLQEQNCLVEDDVRRRFATLIDSVTSEYSQFLELTHRPKAQLLVEYQNKVEDWKRASYRFGRSFAEALAMLGTSKAEFDGLYRMILI